MMATPKMKTPRPMREVHSRLHKLRKKAADQDLATGNPPDSTFHNEGVEDRRVEKIKEELEGGE
jgi:hypothetical protein